MTETADAAGFTPRSTEDVFGSRQVERQTEPAGRPEPEAAPQVEEQSGEATAAPPEPKDGRARDAAGRFAPKAGEAEQPATGSPPAEQPQAQQHIPPSVLVEERRKWQAKVAALEAQIAQRQAAPPPPVAPQQPAQPQVPLTDLMFQEPERFVQTLQQRQDEAMLQTRIAMSEAVARQQPDYDEAAKAVEAYARSHPKRGQEVAAEIRGHAAPALWALDFGRKILAHQKWQPIQQQYATPEAYAEAQREQWMAERTQPAPSPAPPSPPPASLSGARSASPRAQSTWTGPRPTGAVWGRR